MGSNKSIRSLVVPFIKRQLFGKKFSAVIDITEKCNLKCRHCYHRGKLSHIDTVSLTEWEERFKTYRRMGIVYAICAGGEPTLRYDVLECAEKYFPFISVFTNGQIKIPKAFNRPIHLSLDGLREMNDAVRGEGVFDRAVSNYSGDHRVVVNCILSKINYTSPERLEAFINFVRSMNVAGLTVTFFLPQSTHPHDAALVLDEAEWRDVGTVLKRELQRSDSILFDTEDAIDRSVNNTFIPGRCSCREGNYFISADNTFKKCISEANDCTQCRNQGRYYVPFYHMRKWWQFKQMMLKWNIKRPKKKPAIHMGILRENAYSI